MVQKTNKNHIRLKRTAKENDLTQEMVYRILMLHELGISPEAIRQDVFETCHAKVSLSLINKTTNKMNYLVDEWLNRLRRGIGASDVPYQTSIRV